MFSSTSTVTIVRNDGMVMNNYSGFGHYIEMVPAVINTTGEFGEKGISTNNASSSGNSKTLPISKKDNLTAAFGEWSLIDSEVIPVQKVMEKYNWTTEGYGKIQLDINSFTSSYVR